MKGLDINIRGLTNGNHFDMIRQHCKDGGDLDWKHLLSGGGQLVTRKVWGNTYKVEIYYSKTEQVFIALCS